MSSSSSDEELSRVRSITSAFLVELGSVQTDKIEDCRNGTKAKRQRFLQLISLIFNINYVTADFQSVEPPWDFLRKSCMTLQKSSMDKETLP